MTERRRTDEVVDHGKDDDGAPVLVTGASGFIAKHCIKALLGAGHVVRGTVRSRARTGDSVHAAVGLAVDDPRLTLIEADLTADAGWAQAVAGCVHVLHVASPFPLKLPRSREAVIGPARDGALRVMRAAASAGVNRVVMTSSIVAVMYPRADRADRRFTAADWTDPERSDISAYVASKTIAERAVREFVAATPGAPEIVTVHPGFVAGPALDADLSTSVEVIRQMMVGRHRAAPRAGWPVVDVRDAADLHVAAMTAPDIAGERIIAASGSMMLMAMGQAIAAQYPELRQKLPRFEVPDFAVRAVAFLDSSIAAVLPDLGGMRHIEADRAPILLGRPLVSPRAAVLATAESLIALGLVRTAA